MLCLADNPPTTYSAEGTELLSVRDWHKTWWVAYTKPRQEKSLARDLLERNITYFLPMVLRETSSGGRRRRNMYPLFPSYLFFAGDDDARLSCLRTERVVQMLDAVGENQYRLQQELSALAVILDHSPGEIELYSSLLPGAHVRVKSGPLRDVEGTIIETNNGHKLQLAVSLLGVGAVVEIHPDLVERQ